jgi:hypothetical protein
MTPPDVPRPPALALARRHAVVATICAGAAGLSAVAGLGVLVPVLASGMIVFAAFGWLTARDAWGAALSHAALQEITRGRFENVAPLHARIPARSLRRGTVARAVAYQRALLALYRGAPDEAIAALEPAVASATGILGRTHERLQQASALALRAFAHASRGDAAKAEADASAAEAMPEAAGDAIARAALARALVMARAGDVDALAAYLAKNTSTMLESTLPRERALVRALRRLARSRSRSVYREPAKPADETSDAGRLADWIARVAPEAAAHARGDVFAERIETRRAPDASPAAMQAIARERAAASRGARGRRTRAFALLFAALAIGMGLMLGGAGGTVAVSGAAAVDPAGGAASPLGLFLGVFILVFAFGFMAFQIARARRLNAPLMAANRALARGDDAAAERLATELTRSSSALFACAGHAAKATLAERRAHIVAASAAIAALGDTAAMRAVAAPQLLPAALSVRAVSLAALGQKEEATAELATLLGAHGTWGHAAATEHRVRLLLAVKSGDLDEARAIARERTVELPIPLRDEVLADLVLAVGPDGLAKDERERLAAELDADARLRAWIDAVAPGLRDRFARSSAEPAPIRVAADADAEEPQDHEEAAAELARS